VTLSADIRKETLKRYIELLLDLSGDVTEGVTVRGFLRQGLAMDVELSNF
jgi:hypothetical protein